MSEQRKEHRDRLIVLGFVSILLILIYGPGARWFMAADRFVFDVLAGQVRAVSLQDAVIVSIDPVVKTRDEILSDYGRVIEVLQAADVRQVVLPDPPVIADGDELPGWIALLSASVPVFVPTDSRLANVADHTGVFDLRSDSDDILRRSQLWYLRGESVSPALPLAVALAGKNYSADAMGALGDFHIYHSVYAPIPRLKAENIINDMTAATALRGQTVFVDASPELSGSMAMLPSGQFVTPSEITAQIIAEVEAGRTISAPSWIRAMEWLVPALVAILATLFLPARNRRDIVLIAAISVLVLILLEALFLLIGRVRLDLGRAAIIVLGAAAISGWLAGAVRKASVNAFKRGSDFLMAGRLEPAFAEFRRCEPTETVASAMYKLSLAFEEQAKPERADAVIQWMKQTQGTAPAENKFSLGGKSGTPQRLGRYVIERKLGRGAMGAVYLARDPRINREIALKVIPIEKEFEDEELEEARLRFFREAESAGRLTHPNIITVYDCGEDKHLAYIAMEYLQGISLTEFTDPKRLLAPNKALELCARTAEALDYAHNQGVIHRDIKPANLLYSLRQDLLKISDFGVARLTDNNRTKTGIVLGTPMYMSPEQLNADDLTGHSDLFSLGVTLYELLVGEVPFKASNIAVLMTKITTDEPAPVSNRRPGIPPSVDTVLFKALAKKPENRFANGAEMAAALRNCARYAA